MSSLEDAFGHAWDITQSVWSDRVDRMGLREIGAWIALDLGYTGKGAISKALADVAGVTERTAQRWITEAGQQRNPSKAAEAKVREAGSRAILAALESGDYEMGVDFEDTEVEVYS